MNTHDLFKNKSYLSDTPEDLSTRIVARIEQVAQRADRQNRYIWGGVSILSFFFVLGSGWKAFGALATSDFGTYFSLIFSDTSAVLSLWKALILSLVDSLPVLEFGLLFGSIALLGWSLRTFSKNKGHLLTRA